jgi:hypothetical protein
MDRLRRLVPGSAPRSTTSHPWGRAGDPPPVLPNEGARCLGIVAVVIIMAPVVWEGLSALGVQAEHRVAPRFGQAWGLPEGGKSGRIPACPRGLCPVERESSHESATVRLENGARA